MCQEQWSCRECQECHSTADPCGCPEQVEKKFVATVCTYLNIFFGFYKHHWPETSTVLFIQALHWYLQHLATGRVSARCPTWSSTHDRSKADGGIWQKWRDMLFIYEMVKVLRHRGRDYHSRLSQTGEVFVCYSSDPLVGVVKVDQ